jgi:hypothetical protein
VWNNTDQSKYERNKLDFAEIIDKNDCGRKNIREKR